MKLLFIDCDSTLSAIEGIDELARARGEDTYQKVAALTHQAMNGKIPLEDVFSRRMDLIRPSQDLCNEVADLYISHLVEGAHFFIHRMKRDGWTPVILSGGFMPIIRPLADRLGIHHVEAVPIYFHDDGSYSGYGSHFPTTRNDGKREIIRQWRENRKPQGVVMIGDGVTDLETRPEIDVFVGFGGVIEREAVRDAADIWITRYEPVDHLISLIDKKMKIRLAMGPREPIMPPAMSSKKAKTSKAAKPAKAASAGTPSKGKRYTAEEKQEILNFINEHNLANKGRGGQTAAATKFGVSQLTLAGWLKKSGTPAKPAKVKAEAPAATTAEAPAAAPKKRGRKPKAATAAPAPKAAKAPKAPKAAVATSGLSFNDKLKALLAVSQEIEAAEAGLASLKAKFDSLKAAL